MRKVITLSVISLGIVVITGCTQQAPTTNHDINQPAVDQKQNTNQPTADINQNTDQPTNGMVIPKNAKIYTPKEINESKDELIGVEIFVKGRAVKCNIACTHSIPSSCSYELALKDYSPKPFPDIVILQDNRDDNQYNGKRVGCNNSTCYPIMINNIYVVKGILKGKKYPNIKITKYYLEFSEFEEIK